MSKLSSLTLMSIMFSLLTSSAFACSAFLLKEKENKIFGQSYYWYHEAGIIVANQKNVQKKALSLNPQERGAEWVSKYGSLTFNQYGREFPSSGMNETGLVIAPLWLEAAQDEKPDARPVVSELAWIQYQLDNYSTVKEMTESLNKIRITTVYAKSHYLACDANGECGVFEWVEGKARIYTGAALAVPALTNNTYRGSMMYLERFEGFGGKGKMPEYSTDPLIRFARVGLQLSGEASLSKANEIIQSVRQEATIWNLMYDRKTKTAYYRSNSSPKWKFIQLGKLNFSCKKPVLMANIKSFAPTESQEMTNALVPYDARLNYAVVKENMASVPQGEKLSLPISQYPESTVCTE